MRFGHLADTEASRAGCRRLRELALPWGKRKEVNAEPLRNHHGASRWTPGVRLRWRAAQHRPPPAKAAPVRRSSAYIRAKSRCCPRCSRLSMWGSAGRAVGWRTSTWAEVSISFDPHGRKPWRSRTTYRRSPSGWSRASGQSRRSHRGHVDRVQMTRGFLVQRVSATVDRFSW